MFVKKKQIILMTGKAIIFNGFILKFFPASMLRSPGDYSSISN